MNRLADLADELEYPCRLPGISACHNSREKVISKAIGNKNFQDRYHCVNGEYWYRGSTKARAQIHVFCPPLLQYIPFALALAAPDHGKTCEFQVVIHLDDRLLNGSLYSAQEGHESMLQLNDFVRSNAELGEPIDTFESRRQFLATRFDQVWMDQRITALASGERTSGEIDASEYFRVSKESHAVALMVIMAGSQICDNVTRTAPLACPDNPIQPSQIYRLQELADVGDESLFRWKTTHFCRIYSP